MKPEQLAKRLNVTSATLRNWAAKDVTEFLSPSAQGQNGSRRSFNDRDARILFWVAQMREQNIAIGDIVFTLRSAQAKGWVGLPEIPPAIEDEVSLVPREAVEERVRGLQERYEQQAETLKRERDDLQDRLGKAETKNAQLEQKLIAITEQLLDLNRELTSLLKQGNRRGK
ncbi:MAG: MerR family transcriptional regulator [Chloroflexota bacterium]